MTTTKKKPAKKLPTTQLSKGARKLPPTHLSIRVPWHDSGWDGTVCRDPKANTSCNVLARIGEGKRDDEEVKSAGKSLNVLNAHELPPCIGERAAFMSKTPLVRITEHPYASYQEQYKHFKKTQFVHEPFSAACVPFRWMLSAQAVGS